MMSDQELDADMARRKRRFPCVSLPMPLIEKTEQVRVSSKSSFDREAAIEKLQKHREELAQNKRVICEQKRSRAGFLRNPRQGN
jgi:hypothetical protein